MSHGNDPIRVVVVGKTGAGKSSLGNTLLGGNVFRLIRGFNSFTQRCEWAQAYCQGTLLMVTDTPGVIDNLRPEDEVMREIGKSMAVASPGPHVVLMVISITRFTEEEYQAYVVLKRLFGENITRFLIVVFTGLDKLKGDTPEERFQSFKEDLSRVSKTPGYVDRLKEVLTDVGWRWFAISNIDPWPLRTRQAGRLVHKMQGLISRNNVAGYSYFTNAMLEDISSRVDQMVQRRVGNTHVTPERAAVETREAIINDKEEPSYFVELGKTFLQNVVTLAIPMVAEKVVIFAASKCSVM